MLLPSSVICVDKAFPGFGEEEQAVWWGGKPRADGFLLKCKRADRTRQALVRQLARRGAGGLGEVWRPAPRAMTSSPFLIWKNSHQEGDGDAAGGVLDGVGEVLAREPCSRSLGRAIAPWHLMASSPLATPTTSASVHDRVESRQSVSEREDLSRVLIAVRSRRLHQF